MHICIILLLFSTIVFCCSFYVACNRCAVLICSFKHQFLFCLLMLFYFWVFIILKWPICIDTCICFILVFWNTVQILVTGFLLLHFWVFQLLESQQFIICSNCYCSRIYLFIFFYLYIHSHLFTSALSCACFLSQFFKLVLLYWENRKAWPIIDVCGLSIEILSYKYRVVQKNCTKFMAPAGNCTIEKQCTLVHKNMPLLFFSITLWHIGQFE